MGLLESFACLKGKVVNFKSDTNVRQLLCEVQYPSKVCKLQFSKSKSNTITNPVENEEAGSNFYFVKALKTDIDEEY